MALARVFGDLAGCVVLGLFQLVIGGKERLELGFGISGLREVVGVGLEQHLKGTHTELSRSQSANFSSKAAFSPGSLRWSRGMAFQ